MMAVIIEAGKDGKVYDITDHSKRKYEVWHYAENGHVPGSGGSFSYNDYEYDNDYTNVRAHLCIYVMWTLQTLQKITFLIRVLVSLMENAPY